MDINAFNITYRRLVQSNLMILADSHLNDLFFATTPLHSKVDKLDFIEFIMAVEEEFEVEIPQDDAEKMETLADIADWLGEHMEEEAFVVYSQMCSERDRDDE